MSCGSDPMEFVGLFEHRLMGPVAFRLGVLEKAMMDGSNPLMMFEFDHNYTDMQEKVAFIFSHIVHKYFENNEQIMEIELTAAYIICQSRSIHSAINASYQRRMCEETKHKIFTFVDED
eukprot:248818_1